MGHVVLAGGVTTDPEKIVAVGWVCSAQEAIAKFFGFYIIENFIKKFSSLTKLCMSLRKIILNSFGTKSQKAF